jgi:inorganic pyrophosphatase
MACEVTKLNRSANGLHQMAGDANAQNAQMIHNIPTNSGFHGNYVKVIRVAMLQYNMYTNTHTHHSGFPANYGHIHGSTTYKRTHASGFQGNFVNGCVFPALVERFPW